MSESMNAGRGGGDAFDEAYRKGRRAGLATAALALSVVAFISLLGLEKAILAGVLGGLAMRGAPAGSEGWRLGRAAVAVAAVYAVVFVILLAVFHEKFGQLIRLLQQMG